MKIWHYGDDINTDMLFPGKYTYSCSTAEEIRPHLLEDLDPQFAVDARHGDIILAGKNFGCGSSREQPVVGLRSLGIQAIIAKSFARIFYRAAINQGLLAIESPEAIDNYHEGCTLHLDIEEGRIEINGKRFTFPKLPPQILAIQRSGGLLSYTRQMLEQKR